jgi:hypothetical protein
LLLGFKFYIATRFFRDIAKSVPLGLLIGQPFLANAGVYILENPPSPQEGGKYQLMSFGGKNMKRPREKGGKCCRKRKKGGRKRKKGKRKLEKEK